MGPGPIPWRSVVEYASYYELDMDETDELLFMIRKMDGAFLRYHQKRMEDKAKK